MVYVFIVVLIWYIYRKIRLCCVGVFCGDYCDLEGLEVIDICNNWRVEIVFKID